MKDNFPELRKSLFWDIDQSEIDPEKHSRFVISRVMHRGKLDEWKAIENYYGQDLIKSLIAEIKWEDPKTEALFKLWYQ